MSAEHTFTRENLNTYLRELGKEFRKINGTVRSAEVVLVGGAAILANYNFREMTRDIEAVIHASSAMRDAINHVGEKYGLPRWWFNTDFIRTTSHTNKIPQYSKHYKTFSNVLHIRTINAEHLIAMKLVSGREYKYDLSDIVGILAEHEKAGKIITFEDINRAMLEMYDGWDMVSDEARDFLNHTLKQPSLEAFFSQIRAEEKRNNKIIRDIDEYDSQWMKNESASAVLKKLKNIESQIWDEDLEL